MYRLFYTLGIKSYGAAISLAAVFNAKARSWKEGRKGLFKKLRQLELADQDVWWFHAASLGEAEQGLPVMQKVKETDPSRKILLTFFSPSGMEHFKNKGWADFIVYLPLDTPANARKFLDLVQPQLAFFIKYEIWGNFFREICKRQIPLIVAPAIFRKDRFYFKSPHKTFFLPILKEISSIMVQDENSEKVLKQHGIERVKVVGDSRFDRVKQNAQTPFRDEVLEHFVAENEKVLVGGSTWEPGEEILARAKEAFPELKFIIAPHDISPGNIDRVQKIFGKEAFRYSSKPEDPKAFRVCIIDNIGMLSKIYRYGHLAYIGGAFGKGIHNSLEAVAYGLPVFFGPNHHAFIEPAQMIGRGFGFEIRSAEDLINDLGPLLKDEDKLARLSQKAREFVEEKAGSVEKIFEEVRLLTQ